MSERIPFLSTAVFVLSILVCISACSNIAFIDNSSINTLKPDIPPLTSGTLSNGGKEYQGRTNITFLLETPINTPINSNIYLSGTFDDWSGGGNDKYKFHKVTSNTYQLTVEEDAGKVLQFKVTRGSWELGEVDERGRRIGNRVLYVRNKPLHVKLSVNNWNDKSEEIENIDAGFWDTPTPSFINDLLRPSLELKGDRTVNVASIEEYIDAGTVAYSHKGVDISSNVGTKGIPEVNAIGDYLITYNVKDSEGRQAIPVMSMLRIVGNKPTNHTLRPIGSTSSHFGYIEQLPADYGKNTKIKYPLFIYHHGAGGEAASMNLTRTTSLSQLFNSWDGGPARIAIRNHWNTKSSLIVLSPQRSYFESDISRIDAFVDYAVKNYQVDPNRVYMGGFSAGGVISWEYAIKYSDKVAAILPMAGYIPPHLNGQICNAKSVAIWAFHGMDDTAVDVKKAKNAIEDFNECQPRGMAKLTLFDNTGHSSHQRVLDLTGMFEYSKLGDPFDENIYTWLMIQSLSNN